MSIPGGAPSLFLAAAAGAAAGFSIDRSIRLNSGDSAYLNKTPSSAGNQKKWTWSGWVKRAGSGANKALFGTDVSNNTVQLVYNSSDNLRFQVVVSGSSTFIDTNAVFRDFSAWYHVVLMFDSAQGTAANRTKIYVNGVEQSVTGSFCTQNTDGIWNSANAMNLGQTGESGANYYFDGYLAEVNFIDGSALDPTSFGKFDDNNVWQPKDTSSLTFGTNGFRLKFDDNSSSAALGTDSSGNGNNWSVNNLQSVTGNFGNYASAITAPSGGYWSGTPATRIFDGSTSTSIQPYSANSLVWDVSSFGFTGTIEYYVSGSNSSIQHGGSTVYTTSTAGWSSAISINGVSTVTFSRSGAGPSVHAVRLNGSILIDSSHAAANDSFRDTPTNGDTANDTGAGGEITGNYATLNPLVRLGDPNATFSDGNLTASFTSANNYAVATIGITSGKYYYELTASTGVSSSDGATYIRAFTATGVSETFYHWRANGGTSGLTGSPTLSTYASGDVLGVGIDATNSTVRFYKNGTLQGSGDYTYTTFSGKALFIAAFANPGNRTCHWNFGQRPFAYTAPSGYKCLCTANLPDPTIADGSTAFDAKLWTGNGSSQNITGYNFSPDVVWTKQRNSAGFHALFDPIRGVYNAIRPSSSGGTYTDNGLLTAFNSDGFSIGSAGDINSNNNTYVGWAWDAGSSTATNTDGTISAQVRASPSAGISIVSYTGTGANATVGSGLNAKPGLILIKNRSVNGDWAVYHQSLGATKRLILNNTNAQLTQSVFMNDTEPTASVFSLGTSGNVNGSGNSLVAYCFAPVEGYSAFGSYTGNSNADGPFLYLNFTPKLVLLKRTNADSAWVMFDTERSPSNEIIDWLRPNGADGESTNNKFDIVSNGIKFRKADSFSNDSAGTFIYAAFAEHPFKTARAR